MPKMLAFNFSRVRLGISIATAAICVPLLVYLLLSELTDLVPQVSDRRNAFLPIMPFAIIYGVAQFNSSLRRFLHKGPGMRIDKDQIWLFPYNGRRPIQWRDVAKIRVQDLTRFSPAKNGYWKLTIVTQKGDEAKIVSHHFRTRDYDEIFGLLHRFASAEALVGVPPRPPRNESVAISKDA